MEKSRLDLRFWNLIFLLINEAWSREGKASVLFFYHAFNLTSAKNHETLSSDMINLLNGFMRAYSTAPFVLSGDLVQTLTRLCGCRDGGHFKYRHPQIFQSQFGRVALTPLPA